LFFFFFGLSGIIGSLLGGQVIDHLGGSKLYLLMGAFSFIGVILLSLYHLLPKPVPQHFKNERSQ